MLVLDETEILQLKDKITDSICHTLCDNSLCPSKMTCTECINFVLKNVSI